MSKRKANKTYKVTRNSQSVIVSARHAKGARSVASSELGHLTIHNSTVEQVSNKLATNKPEPQHAG